MPASIPGASDACDTNFLGKSRHVNQESIRSQSRAITTGYHNDLCSGIVRHARCKLRSANSTTAIRTALILQWQAFDSVAQ